jgi:hypothetical protein
LNCPAVFTALYGRIDSQLPVLAGIDPGIDPGIDDVAAANGHHVLAGSLDKPEHGDRRLTATGCGRRICPFSRKMRQLTLF